MLYSSLVHTKRTSPALICGGGVEIWEVDAVPLVVVGVVVVASLEVVGFEAVAVVVVVGRVKTGGGTLENTGGGGARDGIMRGGGGRVKEAVL